MSKKKNKKKDDYNLAKILLMTAIIELINKLLDVIIKLLNHWGI
ncbi:MULTISPECIES: hypothetical protein [Peptostreptococcus]|nr:MULTISPECIES: hypothetical protein [Peptostreptococcus]